MNSPLLISAPPTAFTESGDLDYLSTARILEHTLEGGVDSVFVNGTTGEFPSLNLEERRRLLELAIKVAGHERVIAHVGSASPYEAGLLAADAKELGVNQLSVITPFYLPASLDGIRRQISAVVSAAPGSDLYLYLFPDRTGVNIEPNAAAQLLEEFDLKGAKLSVPGTRYVADVVSALGTPRTILSGNDGLMREVVALGGAGVVSGISSSLPAPFAALKRAIEADDRAEAIEGLAAHVNRIVPILGPSIGALKLSLFVQGIIKSPTSRMAIDAPDADLAQKVRRAVADTHQLQPSAG
jgi:4-hydroxy-tetrahydrodipicolinate synthase